MSKQYRPATIQDGLEVANNLRDEDRAEVEGLGNIPILHVPYGVLISDHATAILMKDGSLGGLAGITQVEKGVGQIWMLCTPNIIQEPITFFRQSKRWMAEVEGNYRLLWNLADARNHVHHQLLRFLGFKALRVIPAGPQQLPYFEIVRLCANQ